MRRLVLLPGLTLLLACAPDSASTTAPEPAGVTDAPAAEHPLDHLVVITDAEGSALPMERLLDRLAEYDVVFVGETHLDDTTHRIEHAIYEGLLARREGKVVLSMEMFQRDVQPILDRYVAGEIDEATFLAESRPWHNYRTGYRPLIETARAGGHPVVAANLPVGLQRKLGRGGAEAWSKLTAEDKALLPAEILDGSEAYWERIAMTLRDAGHGGTAPRDPEKRRFAIQNLWDNCMGDAVAQARKAHPEHQVVHVVGGFHVEYHQGTVDQLRQRDPDAKIAVVSVVPTADLTDVEPGSTERADFIVHASARARGPQSGQLAVTVPVEQRYRLHLPPGLGPDERVPLLVWLPDAEVPAEAAMDYWTRTLGDRVAVVVVDPTHAETLPDLRVAGRWTRAESLDADLERGVRAVERVVEYAVRRLPIDPTRIAVAGAREGGTVAAWVGLYGTRPPGVKLAGVAWKPEDWHRLDTAPLSSVAEDGQVWLLGPPEKTKSIVEAYQAAGIEAKAVVDRGASLDDPNLEESLASPLALRLDDTPPGQRPWLVLEDDAPAGRTWAILHAAAQSKLDGRPVDWAPASRLAAGRPIPDPVGRLGVRLDPMRKGAKARPNDFGPETFAQGDGLPLAPGAFGGTTVLVVPKGASKAARKAWLALAEQDVLKKRSRFHHLAVACEDGGPSLAEVLEQVRESGRRNVLVVPVAFAADADRMRRLKREAELHGQDLDLNYLPGLGGSLLDVRVGSGG